MTAVNKFVAIVPAAGIGSRMNASVAKQYLHIDTKTVIEHTLAGLLSHPQISRVIVVLHPNDSVFCTLNISQNPRVSCVVGGEERVDSVLNGLRAHVNDPQTDEHAWVLVHDAARPCVTHNEISRLLAIPANSDGAILGVPVADTLKKANISEHDKYAEIQQTVDRQALWQAQTPQFFPLKSLLQAIELAQKNKVTITDEASAMEYVNANVKLVEGRSTNLKITRPSDLALAAFYLRNETLINDNKKQGGTTCSA